MTNEKIKKEFILSSCDKVKQICKGLFSQTGITFYNFVRLYNDGSRITLYSDQAWGHFFLEEYKKYGLIFENSLTVKNKYIVWDTAENIAKSQLITIAREAFNIDHGFTMIDITKAYIDFHYFASSSTHAHMNSYYVNNLANLHAFSYYFLEKSDFLIKKAFQHRLVLQTSQSCVRKIKHAIAKAEKTNFLNEIGQFYLKGTYEGVSLTAREAECLALKFQGKPFKELACILNISPRTAETHVNKAKAKLNCDSLSEMSKILVSSGLKEIFYLIYK